jgi:MerR family transcriptional regulator, light-induced transcriptional regulator
MDEAAVEQPLHAVESASYTIGELSEQTGVSPATLRMWEIRYGFPDPRRRESGHRRYTGDDVEDIREIVRMRSEGLRLDAAVAQVVSRGDTRDKVAHETVAHRPGPGRGGGSGDDGPGQSASVTDVTDVTEAGRGGREERRRSPERRTPTAADLGEPAPSVFATVRRLHPEVAPQRLTKETLKRLCWGMEDEFCSRALPGEIFGFFQQTKHYRSSRSRWAQVAALAHHAYAFAQLSDRETAEAAAPRTEEQSGAPAHRVGDPDVWSRVGPTLVDLPRTHVMTREWVLVCDAPGAPAVLAAWELPGQAGVPDNERRFETVWTLDPEVVRRAAQACVAVAAELGAPEADAVAQRLAVAPLSAAQPTAAASMFGRVLAYSEDPRS